MAHSSRSATSRNLVTASQSTHSLTHTHTHCSSQHQTQRTHRHEPPLQPYQAARQPGQLTQLSSSRFGTSDKPLPPMPLCCLDPFRLLRLNLSISQQLADSYSSASFSYNIIAAPFPMRAATAFYPNLAMKHCNSTQPCTIFNVLSTGCLDYHQLFLFGTRATIKEDLQVPHSVL